MNRHNVEDWLLEYDMPPAQPDGAGGPPTTDPYTGIGAEAGGQETMPDPNISNINQNVANQVQQQQEPDDVSRDPQSPDMPEEKEKINDFEVWRNKFLKESIKGDTNNLIDMLNQVRDMDSLSPYQKKFIEDNLNIQYIRQNSNIDKASKELRRNLRAQLDKNNPATSVVSHMIPVLETIPPIKEIFVKLNGYGSLKGDLHRKLIASLTGSVQVGNGANNTDIIFNEKEYSISISTRFNAKWGEVVLGNWSLREDDPERYLKTPEIKRLQEGSPEEKDVLRRRIVMESISDLFETRAFIINVVGTDGTIHTLGWDLANSLRSAYTEGRLVVKTRHSDNSEAMITDDGEIIPFVDLSIKYLKETGRQDEDGSPEKEELDFIERRDGILFLTASEQLIKEGSTALQGCIFKETPYMGNPSDLISLQRCVYSSHDLIMRKC